MLKKDENLLQEYDSIFKTQLEAGITELVPKDEEDFEGAHFLPHHGVLRENRETTKLRIIFDGSARADKNHYSLKDCLEKGPKLTLRVFEVLAKFTSYPVGLTADIEKAFHQISVNPADRDQLRFLWFKNIKEERPEIVQYRFRRLVFGLTSSPAILNGTIQHHLSHYKEPEPQVSELLANSLYVDDFAGGASDNESAIHVYQRAKAIMKEGGFNLCKWKTNSSIVRQRISEEKKEEDDKSEVKILGLNWDTMSDELLFESRNRTGAIEQSIRVGDIVVLREEGSAHCWWRLAKVTELLKSRDNVVRSAKIQVLNTDAQRRPTVLRAQLNISYHWK